MMRQGRERGVTLMEVLIAMTLLSLLSAAMLFALRIGLDSLHKTNDKLMENRRVAGAQRVLQQELEGLIPVMAVCSAGPSAVRMPFFQGEAQAMRLVSTFSLQQGGRGRAQILELLVIPGAEGRGVRLVVNEIPYTGAAGAGQLCLGRVADPVNGGTLPQFLPVTAGPHSFVLADKIAGCRFAYLAPPQDPKNPPSWTQRWILPGWPMGIRIDMAPLDPDPSHLQPISVVAPIYLHRSPEVPYADN